MSDKAIIQTETKVIRRITTDDSPALASDESVVVLAEKITLDKFYKLVDGKLLIPTQDEIDKSGVDEARNAILFNAKRERVKTALDAMTKNGDPMVQEFASAFKDLF